MRYYIILIILANGLICYNEAHANDIWVDFNISSHHSIDYYMKDDKKQYFNENNLGIGLTKEIDNTFDIKGGFFENSYNKPSFYIGTNLKYKIDSTFETGLTLGVVTGYQGTPEINTVLRAMVLPNISTRVYDVRLNLGILPMINLDGGYGSTLTVQLGVLI